MRNRAQPDLAAGSSPLFNIEFIFTRQRASRMTMYSAMAHAASLTAWCVHVDRRRCGLRSAGRPGAGNVGRAPDLRASYVLGRRDGLGAALGEKPTQSESNKCSLPRSGTYTMYSNMTIS